MKNPLSNYKIFIAGHRVMVRDILANSTYPTEFLYENIYIQTNLVKFAYENKVKHLINLGSSCIYPKNSKQPIKEKY